MVRKGGGGIMVKWFFLFDSLQVVKKLRGRSLQMHI